MWASTARGHLELTVKEEEAPDKEFGQPLEKMGKCGPPESSEGSRLLMPWFWVFWHLNNKIIYLYCFKLLWRVISYKRRKK